MRAPLKTERPRSSPLMACLRRFWPGIAFLAAVLFSSSAFAAETGKASEATLLIQLTVLVVVGRLFGEVLLRIGQPAVMGQLLAGIALGPSLLGWVLPGLQTAIFPADPVQNSMIQGI